MRLIYSKSLDVAFDVESIEAITPVRGVPDECVIAFSSGTELHIRMSVEQAYDTIVKTLE